MGLDNTIGQHGGHASCCCCELGLMEYLTSNRKRAMKAMREIAAMASVLTIQAYAVPPASIDKHIYSRSDNGRTKSR
jgi:hypothetical protein